MAATVVNSLQQIGNTATAAIAYTATTGNKLLVTMRCTSTTVSAPTQLSGQTGSPFTDGSGQCYAWIRDVQAGDPTTWNFSSITGTWLINFIEISGAVAGAPDVFAFAHNATTTTPTSPSITTTAADLCISVFTVAGVNVTFSGETYTQIAEKNQASPAGSTLAGMFTQSSAGATSDSVTMSATAQTGAFTFGFSSASSGSTGTLNETLGGSTLSATAQATDTAVASQTLGAASLASTAQAIVTASVSRTLGAVTASASGVVIDSGSVSGTLGAASLTASAQAIDKGAVSQTLGAATLSATGTHPSVTVNVLTLGTKLSNALSVQTALHNSVLVPTKLSKSITLNTTLR